MKTAVEFLEEMYYPDYLPKIIIEKAKEMEIENSVTLLEWIRENTFEIPNGWQYLGVTYSDKQLIEKYNEIFKNKQYENSSRMVIRYSCNRK